MTTTKNAPTTPALDINALVQQAVAAALAAQTTAQENAEPKKVSKDTQVVSEEKNQKGITYDGGLSFQVSNGNLIINIPLGKPNLSSGGKMLTCGQTGKMLTTGCKWGGKELFFSGYAGTWVKERGK